jgi:hypothetical protein
MAIRKSKPDKVTVNAGATVEVQFGDETLRFNCSGSNASRDLSPAQVLKNLKDCIEHASKSKPRKKK